MKKNEFDIFRKNLQEGIEQSFGRCEDPYQEASSIYSYALGYMGGNPTRTFTGKQINTLVEMINIFLRRRI